MCGAASGPGPNSAGAKRGIPRRREARRRVSCVEVQVPSWARRVDMTYIRTRLLVIGLD